MNVLETERLFLRKLTLEDAPFILELVNDPSWLRFIGDKGVRNLEDARDYIRNGPMDMYARLGFGMYLVERKSDRAAVGICGLTKRDFLDRPDVGFALLPQFRLQGYARESAAAVVEHAWKTLGLDRLLAITSPENVVSIRLLDKLGFVFQRMLRQSPTDRVSLFEAANPSPGSERRRKSAR
ncbi:MAG TPA: GNAT family N-acetyltransferase [Thermoanaerobaculia bacterium]